MSDDLRDSCEALPAGPGKEARLSKAELLLSAHNFLNVAALGSESLH